MSNNSVKEEELQKAARKVVKSGFDSMMEKSRVAEDIIDLDDSYDKLELMKHAKYTIDDLRDLRKKLKSEDS